MVVKRVVNALEMADARTLRQVKSEPSTSAVFTCSSPMNTQSGKAWEVP